MAERVSELMRMRARWGALLRLVTNFGTEGRIKRERHTVHITQCVYGGG